MIWYSRYVANEGFDTPKTSSIVCKHSNVCFFRLLKTENNLELNQKFNKIHWKPRLNVHVHYVYMYTVHVYSNDTFVLTHQYSPEETGREAISDFVLSTLIGTSEIILQWWCKHPEKNRDKCTENTSYSTWTKYEPINQQQITHDHRSLY